MAEIITHAFVSTKSDSPDTTLVSASEWNDGHVFSGGINGQVLVYDNTQPNNMRWTDGPTFDASAQAIAVSTPTPVTNFAPLTIVTNTPKIANIVFMIQNYSTVGNASGTVILNLNGSLLSTTPMTSPDIGTRSVIALANLIVGTNTLNLTLTTAGAVNILTISAFIVVSSVGV